MIEVTLSKREWKRLVVNLAKMTSKESFEIAEVLFDSRHWDNDIRILLQYTIDTYNAENPKNQGG